MYHTGDLVIYGNTGVCRISDIKALDYMKTGNEQPYYILTPLFQNCTISAPVNNPKVFMRPIISKEEAQQLIDEIPSIHAEAYHSHVLRQLTDHYEALLDTHDCRSLIELTMSIYTKKQFLLKQKKKFGAIDERFMKRAEDLLFGELSAALDIPRDRISEYIQNRLACCCGESVEQAEEVPAEAFQP